jgi:hypothetical protein
MVEAVEQKRLDDQKAAHNELPSIKGRFDRYNSPFLQLILSVLTTRYLWLALEDINPLNFLNKPEPSLRPGYKPWTNPGPLGYLSRNFTAIAMGATTLGVIAYYSKNTYDDIRTLYSEAVGYELGKKPEEVGWADIFLRSQNKALDVTRNAFLKRTLTRTLSGASFLLPWHMFRDHKDATPKFDANMNAGIGVMGLQLISEGFLRGPSLFDMEQQMVSMAINHENVNSHQIVEPKHIQSLLMMQRKHLNKNYDWPSFISPEGKREAVVATRIADLLNQHYGNTDKKGHVDFNMGKLNYLIGFDLLDSPHSLAFVELANQSKDMKEVNEAAKAIRAGQDAKAVFKNYGIDIDSLNKANYSHLAKDEPVAKTFASAVKPEKEKLPQAARSHQEFAARAAESPSSYIE